MDHTIYQESSHIYYLFPSIYHHKQMLALRPHSTNSIRLYKAELYKAISKEESAHPEVVPLVAGDFNAGKLKSV